MAAFISRISARIAEYVYNDQVEYQPGQLPYSKNGTTLSTQPRQAKREFSQQNILIYEESPEELRQENVLAQIVPNRDGRERIGNTTTWPNSFHAQLSINFNGRTYGGSGAMVGPHHLLTCGHNVYDTKAKAWANEITVYPALNEAQAPFGFAKAIKAYTFSNWTERGERQYDIALLILDKSIGKETGWGGLLSEEDQDLSKEEVNIYGYPGDKGFKQMWGMKHNIHKLEPEEFQYLIDTNGGQSGSAIWIFNHGTPKILGVHTLGSNFGNFGVRLSQQKFQMIVEKIAETYKLKQQTIHKISSPKALVAKTSQNIPPTAFGKAKWAQYFGDVGEEPPLPSNIEQILSEDCPFWPGNKIRDTHLLVLIPETVNGETFTVRGLGKLINNPKEGHPMGYKHAEDRLMNLSSGKSHWVLMTKGVIPETLGKYVWGFNNVLKNHGNYQMPTVLEAATCILMEHVMSGTKLYSTNPYTCARCEEDKGQTVIGGFDDKGINMGLDPRLDHVGIGLAALRPLISSNTVPKASSAAKKALPFSNFSTPDPMDLSITPSRTLKSEIPLIAFGKAKWAQYFGDVGIEPPLSTQYPRNPECSLSHLAREKSA